MTDALTAGGWPVVAHFDSLDDDDRPPAFSIRDPISKTYRIYERGNIRVPEDGEDPTTLEPAAGWDAQHVIDRIMGRISGPYG
jgi:hypothetical protein